VEVALEVRAGAVAAELRVGAALVAVVVRWLLDVVAERV